MVVGGRDVALDNGGDKHTMVLLHVLGARKNIKGKENKIWVNLSNPKRKIQ